MGGLEETVTVTGETPLVDITSKAVGGNITDRELMNLRTRSTSRAAVCCAADYVRTLGRGMFMTQDLNPGLRAQPVRTSPLVRVNREYFTAAVNQLVNVGETDYDALLVGFDKRFSQNYSLKVSYTLGYARGNTSAVGAPNSVTQILDDMNLDANYGPTNVDRRHNFVISGAALVPKTGGMTFSCGARVEDATAERNGAYGPGFFQIDIRLGYRLRLGGVRTLDLFGEVFNLTERVNYGNPSGNQAAALVPGADRLSRRRHPAHGPDRHPFRVLTPHVREGSAESSRRFVDADPLTALGEMAVGWRRRRPRRPAVGRPAATLPDAAVRAPEPGAARGSHPSHSLAAG